VQYSKKLGELLLDSKIISDEQINVALSVQKVQPLFIGEILQNLDFVSSREIAQVIAKQQNIPFIDVQEQHVQTKALKMISKELALDKKVLPLEFDDGLLTVACLDANDIVTTDYLEKTSQCKVKYLICDEEKLSMMIELHYYQLEHPIEERIESIVTQNVEHIDIVELLDLLIQNGIKNRATDIHITPDAHVVHVFYRIDGVLKHSFAFSLKAHQKIVSRVKILSDLDISEQRLPQDGSFSHQFLHQEYDLRLSTLPTSSGENLVLRILSGKTSLLGLESLGLDSNNVKSLAKAFMQPHGMILVTGPTGSGKTTTLYAALRELDALSKNIITVEDPIEYRFAFVKQTEINVKTGYTFSKAIRHFMRQDPDIMLVGEIRDEETARFAVRASITGHMVLSTLHANSALATIPRLLDMGLESDLLSTSLHTIIGQRLLRKVCKNCATIDSYTLENEESIEVLKASPKGCIHCNYTGYHGRTAIVEILNIDREMKALISKRASLLEISDYAYSSGFIPMKQHALAQLKAKQTTVEEINRVLA
jgi:type IV pilus assembly protein PilB